MCFSFLFQASENPNIVMDNDPTNKSAKNPIIVDMDADINTYMINDTKRKRKKMLKVRFIFTEYTNANRNDKLYVITVKSHFWGW